jgi:phage replication-related protein YjqB (UPF0714/DUF867 family)
MSADRYSSFDQLFAHEKLGTDYQIVVENRGASCLIMAPHGGRIEPVTSDIARCIAEDDKSLYLFEGLRKRPHSDLHVTSHKYDEPQAIEIASKCEVVVAVHGRKDRDDPETVWVGGLDVETGSRVVKELNLAGFQSTIEAGELAAVHSKNICNRGRTSKGVQLEIPKSLRVELQSIPERLCVFSAAVRKALSTEQE